MASISPTVTFFASTDSYVYDWVIGEFVSKPGRMPIDFVDKSCGVARNSRGDVFVVVVGESGPVQV